MATEEIDMKPDDTKAESEEIQAEVCDGEDVKIQPECLGDARLSEKQTSGEDSSSSDVNQGEGSSLPKETVDFKVVFNKKKYDVIFPLDDTISLLKNHIHTLTGVTPTMQKLMFKGLAKDSQTLRELKVTKGAKLMLVGSLLNDVAAISSANPEKIRAEDKAQESSKKELLCNQKIHKKVLDKGKPDDLMVGIKNCKENLPPVPVYGVNKTGGKVRLTFKLETDQLWIGTKERTEKVPMNSIKQVVSEAIEGHEEYQIVGIQLGPTEASRYWIYWFPSQYAEAVKDTIMGKWQYF